MAAQVFIRAQPVGESPRPRRRLGLIVCGHLRRWRDHNEDPIRILVDAVADGQVVRLVLGQLLVALDLADRIAGLESDDVVLHQVAEGVVRRVVQRLGKDLGQPVGVGVVIGDIEVETGPGAVGQDQPIVVVAVVVELVAQIGEALAHAALLDQAGANGVV